MLETDSTVAGWTAILTLHISEHYVTCTVNDSSM